MGNKIEYSPERELTEAVEEVLKNPEYRSLKAITEEEVEVASCFMVRTNKDGDALPYKWPPAKVVKVKPEMQIFMKDKPSYVLVMDHSYWEEAKPDEQKKAIHFALCAIQLDKTDAGDLKVGTKKPDVITYSENLLECGAWQPFMQNASEMLSVRDGLRKNASKLTPKTEEDEPEPQEDKPRVKSADEEDEPKEEEEPKPAPRSRTPKTTTPPRSRGRLPEPEPDDDEA